MPSMLHEVLILLFRNRPELAPELLRDALHVKLPRHTDVRVDSAELTDVLPAEYRADLVVLLLDGKPVFGIIVEVQLDRDPRKRLTWPVYLTGLRARLGCPCALLVVSPDANVAAWASAPIDLGPASQVQPLAIGPDGVPVVRDAAAPPELCVLSAMAHGRGNVRTAVEVAIAAAGATAQLDPDRRALYYDLVLAALGEAARKAFEMLPQGYEYQSEPMRRSFHEGKTEGRVEGARALAEATVDILDDRGLVLTEEQRRTVLECSDLEQLRAWARRAWRVATVEDLFGR